MNIGSMKNEIDLLDVVALTKDLPEHNLVAGQVGTVVETLAKGVFEVEFSRTDGTPYAMQALPADTLIVLRYEPVAA